MQKKRCRNSRSRDMPRSCAYACEDTTKFKCFKFCRVFERKKYTYDLRTPCKFKIQIWKSPFLVQRILRRYCRENAKKIQEYIQNQLQNDLEYDQMTLKEYIDPFTGEPVNQNK